MAKVVLDDDDEVTDVPVIDNIGFLNIKTSSAEEVDPFAKPAKVMKELSGISSNHKRKIGTMEKRFEGAGGAESKKLEEEYITGYNAFEVVSPPFNIDYLGRLYDVSPFHHGAVDAKVSNIVGLGYDFIEAPSTKRKLDEMEDQDKVQKFRRKLNKLRDAMHDKIDELNKEDTFAEVLTKVWKDYETTGNGFIEIGRKATGEIGYIGHIQATNIRIRRKRDGFVQIISNKAVFFRNFGDRKTKNPIGNDSNPNEIIHLKKYSPTSGYYGVPDIIAARQAIAGNEFAARYNLDYFENKAVPRHLIVLKGATLGAGASKTLMEFFETGLKGQHHRSLYIPLPGDTADRKVEFSIEPIETKVQDSSFTNYRNSNKEEILVVHRVPITKISVGDGASLAVAKDADKTFKEQVCQPEQKIFEKKLNRVIKELTDLLLLKLNELTLTDENTQSQIDERRRKTGTETANEQRTRRGMPGHKDGDELVDLNAQAKKIASDNKAQGNRERDANRSAKATDSAGEGRAPKGEGRTTA